MHDNRVIWKECLLYKITYHWNYCGYGNDEKEIPLEAGTGRNNVIIMGDWNAAMGEGRDRKEVDSNGLGVKNDRGERGCSIYA